VVDAGVAIRRALLLVLALVVPATPLEVGGVSREARLSEKAEG
jgi:hypothetical protein